MDSGVPRDQLMGLSNYQLLYYIIPAIALF
jgi:hypothetical protein